MAAEWRRGGGWRDGFSAQWWRGGGCGERRGARPISARARGGWNQSRSGARFWPRPQARVPAPPPGRALNPKLRLFTPKLRLLPSNRRVSPQTRAFPPQAGGFCLRTAGFSPRNGAFGLKAAPSLCSLRIPGRGIRDATPRGLHPGPSPPEAAFSHPNRPLFPRNSTQNLPVSRPNPSPGNPAGNPAGNSTRERGIPGRPHGASGLDLKEKKKKR